MPREARYTGFDPPPPAIVQMDEDSAKYQDTAGTTPASSNADPVRRWDNDGTLGGYASFYGTTTPKRYGSVMAAESVYFNNGILQLADADELTPVQGAGFEVFVSMRTTSSNTNRGVVGKWDGGSNNEWYLIHRSSASRIAFGGLSGDYVDDTDQVNDNADHVLHARITTGDDMYISIDGTDSAGPVAISPWPSNNTTAKLNIGSYGQSSSTYYTGYIRAVRIYDQILTTSQRAQVVSEMSA